MTNKINNLLTPDRRRRLSWLAIVPVALLQLTIAVHQFDHVNEYTDDVCHACGQLDRIDVAVDHSAETALPLPAGFLRPSAIAVSATRAAVRGFDARAPPKL